MESIYNLIFENLGKMAQSNQFLQGGLVLAALSFFGYKLNSFFTLLYLKLKSFCIFTINIDSKGGKTYDLFKEWLYTNHPEKFKSVSPYITRKGDDSGDIYNINQDEEEDTKKTPNKVTELRLHQYVDTNLIWYKHRPILVYKEREKLSNSAYIENLYQDIYSLRGLFAKKQMLDLLEELRLKDEIAYKEQDVSKLKTWHFSHDYWREVGTIENTKSFSDLFFSSKQEILELLEKFDKSYAKYLKLKLPYKTGFLFYGPPGTGKTSIASAIAKRLKYDLCKLNLTAIETDKQLERVFSEIPPRSVLLLDDVDCSVGGMKREQGTKEQKFGLSTLLGCLEKELNEVVIIMTTNNKELLDDAMIRKGRIDHQIEIGFPTSHNVKEFLENYYEEEIDLEINNISYSMVTIQEICLRHENINEAVSEINNMEVK